MSLSKTKIVHCKTLEQYLTTVHITKESLQGLRRYASQNKNSTECGVLPVSVLSQNIAKRKNLTKVYAADDTREAGCRRDKNFNQKPIRTCTPMPR